MSINLFTNTGVRLLSLLSVALPDWRITVGTGGGESASRRGVRRLPEGRLYGVGVLRNGVASWILEVAAGVGGKADVSMDALHRALEGIQAAIEDFSDPCLGIDSARFQETGEGTLLVVQFLVRYTPIGDFRQGFFHSAAPVAELDADCGAGESVLSVYTSLGDLQVGDPLVMRFTTAPVCIGIVTRIDGGIHLDRKLAEVLPAGSLLFALRDGVHLAESATEETVTRPEAWLTRHRDLEGRAHTIRFATESRSVNLCLAPCQTRHQRLLALFLGYPSTPMLLLRGDGTIEEAMLVRQAMGEASQGVRLELDVSPIADPGVYTEVSP